MSIILWRKIMIICKHCGKNNHVKNGFVRGKQRYRCKECGHNFTDTPRRGRSEASKALAILLYSMGRASYRFIGNLLDVSAVAVYKWIRKAGLELPSSEPVGEIKEIEIDEVWHFLDSKKTNVGYGKPMIVVSGVVSPGLWATVMLQRYPDSGSESKNPDALTSPIIGRVIPK
jgi:transposase-like protein